LECPRESGRPRDAAHEHLAALWLERSVCQGGQVTDGSAPHCSTIGRVAFSAVPPDWRISLTRAMSRTGTGVAMPQLSSTGLNAGRVSVLPERVTICSS